MEDIITLFPTAEEMKIDNGETYSLLLFEEELRSIFRLIVHSSSRGLDYVYVSALSNSVKDFLLEKGYVICHEDDGYEISW